MYLILNHAERIVDISEEACYVRRQKNGVITRCAEEDADAIYSANTDCFYPLEPTGYIGNGHKLVVVESVPDEVMAGYYFYHSGEFYMTEGSEKELQLAKENETLKEQVTILEDTLTDTQLALCDVYELLMGGEE